MFTTAHVYEMRQGNILFLLLLLLSSFSLFPLSLVARQPDAAIGDRDATRMRVNQQHTKQYEQKNQVDLLYSFLEWQVDLNYGFTLKRQLDESSVSSIEIK